MNIEVKYLTPTAVQNGMRYATERSAAIDLHAACTRPIEIWPGETVMIPTGISVQPDDNDVCSLLIPRSGLGAKTGLVLGNLIGLIDNDYQGEIKIAAWNRNSPVTLQRDGSLVPNFATVQINPGDRIAQLMFVRYVHVERMVRVEDFTAHSERGEGGFGSTGQ